MLSNTLNKIKQYVTYVRGFFPEALPTGMTAFNAYADSIFATYSLPTTKQRDVRWMVATIIANSKGEFRYRSKWYFVKAIRAACVKEIAAGAMMDMRAELQAEQKAAEAAFKAQTNSQASQAAVDVTSVNNTVSVNAVQQKH